MDQPKHGWPKNVRPIKGYPKQDYPKKGYPKQGYAKKGYAKKGCRKGRGHHQDSARKRGPSMRRRENPHRSAGMCPHRIVAAVVGSGGGGGSRTWPGWAGPCPPTAYPPGSNRPAWSTTRPWNCW